MVAVYQRCLANYQSRQWDMGAHVLFNRSLHSAIQATLPTPECFVLPDGSCLSECLLRSQLEGSSNDYCLNEWLRKADVASLDYFEYEQSCATCPTHSCQVFSGPAKLPGSLGEPFRICLEEYSDSGLCKLPHIVWSGRSTNKVPVGKDHATVIADPGIKLSAAQAKYQSIQRDVAAALATMASWNASNLNVMIFSAEGDMLHQFFDCFMMGGDASADLWPGPDDAPKPTWSRSAPDTPAARTFQLPCSGEALRDRLGKRDSKSPFTCGSYSRRAAIKYFLRNVVTMDPTANNNIVKAAVDDLVAKLRAAWLGDLSTYMCQCANGTNAPECCSLDAACDPSTTKCACSDGSPDSYACCETQCTGGTFLPSRFQVQFAKIKGSSMVQSLFDQAARYLNTTVWQDNRPWLTYDMGGAAAYNWTAASLQSPVDEGLFDTTAPIANYDTTELGYPYKTTVWDMCHGLLQQVIFTMPMKSGAPTTVGDAYDPDGASSSLNMTYREDFVRKLVVDAYKASPLYWHYVARHKPSASAMCRKAAPTRPTTSNTSFFVQGFGALKVGGHDVDCYCGWWFNATHCQVPSDVCARLVLLVGSTAVQAACNGGRIATQAQLLVWMPALIGLEGGWKGWQCPSMWISDHWGIMTDHNAWLKGSSDVSQVQDRVLRNGTSGLRVGSLDWLKLNAINYINPAERTQSVQPLQCDLSPPQALVDHFVDDLFPAAQGVRHSAAVGACLRFSIELARLSAYQAAGLVVAAADQSSVVGLWRKRCEMKLRQVAFCQVYGVYDIKSVVPDGTCPFSVSVAFNGQYTLTPSCLAIYNGKVYDPCLCDATFCSTTNTRFSFYNMPDSCTVLHVRDLVLDAGLGLPVWPATSTTSVPAPLARSSFMAKVLYGAGNVANNLASTHWASAEGESNFQYCDVVVDWWPDSWKHPVGYHVTMPCTGAAPRTFDAAWTALKVGTQIKMMYEQSALRNRTMQTNVYGAAGVCRTHNYGMPMKTLNTMRFCTQADNRAVDPSVPGSAAPSADWGLEYCTDSPYQVPWAKGPPSVGTYFNYLVDLLPFAGWGDNAGHAPFRACASDADCCPACKCLLSKSGGVCARLQAGTFECAQHQHCTEKLCAGDGKCVQPVLELHNNASNDIVARIFTDQCRHAAADPWGTSKEDIVPDILQSSGMCSYRLATLEAVAFAQAFPGRCLATVVVAFVQQSIGCFVNFRCKCQGLQCRPVEVG